MSDENNNEQLQTTQPIVEAGTMPLLSEAQFQDLEKRVEQQQRIRQVVLKATKPSQWRIMGESAYLEQSGCKSIAAFLGLGIDVEDPVQVTEKDEEGSYISFTTKVTITFRGRSIDEYGTAHSRDPFLAGDKPQSEVNLGNIKKKSITNAYNRGIKAILGLDFSRVEVEAVIGKIGSAVDYKKKPKEEITADDVTMKNDMKLKIYKMTDKDEGKFKNYIKELTTFKNKAGETIQGKTDFDKISMKQWNFKKTKVNEDYAAWEKEQGGE